MNNTHLVVDVVDVVVDVVEVVVDKLNDVGWVVYFGNKLVQNLYLEDEKVDKVVVVDYMML